MMAEYAEHLAHLLLSKQVMQVCLTCSLLVSISDEGSESCAHLRLRQILVLEQLCEQGYLGLQPAKVFIVLWSRPFS